MFDSLVSLVDRREEALGCALEDRSIAGHLLVDEEEDELTVVHPPVFAPGASGMEYPTLITTGFPWYAGHVSTLVERVTLHELGHQWFYGLVATDEHASPFLDEGLTTYAEWKAMEALFGDGSAISLPGLAVRDG